MVKPHWETEELIENWTLLPTELELVSQKVGGNQIGFALLLKHFQLFAHFPDEKSSIPQIIISYFANQINIPENCYSDFDWQGRSAKVYRVEIRRLFNFRVATVQDSVQMSEWLIKEILPNEQRLESLTELVYQRWRELQIEPPTPGRVERLIRSAITQYETSFCNRTLDRLSPEILTQLDILLTTEKSANPEGTNLPGKLKTSDFAFLKTDPGPVGLGSFLTEIEKLKRILSVGLPTDLFTLISPKLVQTYRQRAATETPYLLRQHPVAIRYTLIAAFCIQRSQEITDNLIDLLIQIIQRLGTRAERRINKELVDDFKQVTGKTNLLFRIAEVAVAQPSGVIQNVIYPVVSQQTLRDLVKEYKSTGLAYRQRVSTYLALMELGRAIKTIFLCQYLDNEAVRREVNEGLNVVERWNGVNDFIFYGKGGEFASNRLETQELSVLSLHLLQICLVYVNTLMIQSVLAQKHWDKKLSVTDLRAITPLLFGHVNPYGTFKLDMNYRIAWLTQPDVA